MIKTVADLIAILQTLPPKTRVRMVDSRYIEQYVIPIEHVQLVEGEKKTFVYLTGRKSQGRPIQPKKEPHP